jgi:hypothetical protein
MNYCEILNNGLKLVCSENVPSGVIFFVPNKIPDHELNKCVTLEDVVEAYAKRSYKLTNIENKEEK